MRMKLIIATDIQNRSVMEKLIGAILKTEHHEAVFMIHNHERNESRALTYHPYRKEYTTHRIDEYHTFYPDYHRNFHNKPVITCSMPAAPYIIAQPGSKMVSGIDFAMLQVIGKMANINFRLKVYLVSKLQTAKILEIFNKTDVSIWFNRMALKYFIKQSVTTPDMSEYVIIAPRGQRLTIPETFLRPLTKAAWILVIAMVVVSFLVMWNFNRYFRNDLILLPVCGIERYNLNQTHFAEKLIVLGLMVFYFLLQSGYESIIISLISDVPYHRDILTFEQLRESKIKVTVIDQHDINFFLPLLEHYHLPVENGTTPEKENLQIDKATLHDDRSGKMLINNPDFYDRTNERKRLNLLQDTISAHPTSYVFRHRTRVQETFERHMHTIFEAGLLNYWAHFFQKMSDSRLKATPPSEDDEIVKFGDLAPFWAVIGVGWSVSIIVFLLERFTTLQLEVKLKAPRNYRNSFQTDAGSIIAEY
ncbi:hypothetical protein ZHAS_00005818 [Anopheles sinensis]|uniref:Ionotropic glutamate receptor L-glutamate and glycine-binding domain-containing protein n=1 Tax=Anopheles sinensis TaxID=74873 RepID=A0A084VKP7_ANOSI|nr:hypothetical protein ZHAS_00005818 [Anopheles sinensis]